MKNILLVCTCLLFSVPVFAAEFVSPIGFDATNENKTAVVEYIKQTVKREYSEIGMDSESILRMMENQNLDAFKKLLSAKDEGVLARVIKEYCGIGMCNYVTIHMMYEQEMKAKGQWLQW